MKIDIEQTKETVSVKVEVKKLHKKRNNTKVKISTKHVLKYLEEKSIKVGECIQSPPMVTNKGNKNQLVGEWVFRKLKKPARYRKKPKKVEKILDKSPKDVIIEVEKKETPILSETQDVTEE
jgi:hypothetical protein